MVCRLHQHRGRRCRRAVHQIQRQRPATDTLAFGDNEAQEAETGVRHRRRPRNQSGGDVPMVRDAAGESVCESSETPLKMAETTLGTVALWRQCPSEFSHALLYGSSCVDHTHAQKGKYFRHQFVPTQLCLPRNPRNLVKSNSSFR